MSKTDIKIKINPNIALAEPPLYRVIYMNDEVTSMNFVVSSLIGYFNYFCVMFNSFRYLWCFLIIASLMLACKPARKSYVPYRKRNKCGCPTYGWHQKNKHETVYCHQRPATKELF
jgi:hypothetical protein